MSRNNPGTLVYACRGGEATATFGAYRFQGSYTAAMLDVRLTTMFRFSDGCDWVSTQRIYGDPRADDAVHLPGGHRAGATRVCSSMLGDGDDHRAAVRPRARPSAAFGGRVGGSTVHHSYSALDPSKSRTDPIWSARRSEVSLS